MDNENNSRDSRKPSLASTGIADDLDSFCFQAECGDQVWSAESVFGESLCLCGYFATGAGIINRHQCKSRQSLQFPVRLLRGESQCAGTRSISESQSSYSGVGRLIGDGVDRKSVV